jgi:hypothetical protein
VGVTGTLTSTSSTGTPVQIHVLLSALESVNNGAFSITVPLIQATTTTATSTLLLTTQAGTTGAPCTSASADCVSYTINLPAQGASVAAFTTSGVSLPSPMAGTASYTIEGQAFTLSSLMAMDCSVPVLTTTVTVIAGGPQVTAPALNFAGCQ